MPLPIAARQPRPLPNLGRSLIKRRPTGETSKAAAGIDAAVAMMMAMGRAMTEDEDQASLELFLANPIM